MNRVRSWPRRNLVCRQAVELVTDYLEGALSPAQRRRFEVHVKGCRYCPEYLAQIRATIAVTGSITPDDLAPQLLDEFVGLYRRWRSDGEGLHG